MADLSGITAVRPTATTVTRVVQYGGTVTAGQALAVNDEKYVPADANASSTLAAASAIAMTSGVADGYGVVALSGPIILVGTTMSVGEVYFASPTAGGIMPASDKATGDWVTILGTAATATQLNLSMKATGVQVP